MQAGKINYAGVGVAVGGVVGIIGVIAKWFSYSTPIANGSVTVSLSGTADWTGSVALVAAFGAFAFGGAYILLTDAKIRRLTGVLMSVCAVFLLMFSLFGYTRISDAVGVPALRFATQAGPGLVISFVGGVLAFAGSVLASRDLFGSGRAADTVEPADPAAPGVVEV